MPAATAFPPDVLSIAADPAAQAADRAAQARALLAAGQERGPDGALATGYLVTGAAGLDAALGGGLRLGAVSALEPQGPLDEPAGDALALALAGVAAGQRPGDVVIVQDPGARAVRGAPYGPGLARLGIAPQRLLLVSPRRPADVRACVEEAARTPGLAAVVGLLGPQAGFALVPARRVQLAVEEAHGLVLLACGLRTAPFLPARARLRVAPVPGTLPAWARGPQALAGLPPPGAPAWRVDILKARGGGRGSFTVEMDHDAASRAPDTAPVRLREPPVLADRTAGAPGEDGAGTLARQPGSRAA
jgi:protein ImuA